MTNDKIIIKICNKSIKLQSFLNQRLNDLDNARQTTSSGRCSSTNIDS